MICSVYGPKEATSKSVYSENGRIVSDFKYAPFSLPKWKEQRQSNDERDISRLIEQALSSSVILEKFPKSVMDVYINVLESDGGDVSIAISCASLALANAGVEMYDLVGCISVVRYTSRMSERSE